MAIPSNYEYVKSKMEIDNFIRYQISEIYFANTDWPGNNIKYWKTKSNGKWRWLLYDTDFGFGFLDPNSYQHNTLQFALAANGPGWPNPPWSTLMLRKLVVNNSFRYEFINGFADFSNTIFNPADVVNTINGISSIITPEIARHSTRWNQFTYDGWLSNVQVLRTFASNRLNYMRAHFMQYFSLAGVAQVNLYNADTTMGHIQINSLDINLPNWSGTYFWVFQ